MKTWWLAIHTRLTRRRSAATNRSPEIMPMLDSHLPLAMPLTPPLKWAGGKRWLLPELLPLWKPLSSRRLVEPFCGALAVTLGLMPERALLNDSNPHLTNFLSWLKRGLKLTLWMEYDRELYYAHRKRFNELLHQGERQS